jgi:hypothetical protein
MERLTRPRSRVRAIVAMLAVAAVAWIAWKQLPPYRAIRRLDDLAWTKGANADELRRTAHLALDSWFADPHDAFLVLEQYGDRSSVPFLRAALARRPANGAVGCTWVHGQDALDRILGDDAGAN